MCIRDRNRSPTMSYAVQTIEDKKKLIPGVVHIDGTCRVQTVEQDIPHLYEVIEEFYKYTKVPMVLNTSFNLAGQPLVETPQDAIDTWKKSDIHVLWFPEARRMFKSSSLGD